MADFRHADLWVAVAAAGPILLLAMAVTVNIYDLWKPLRSVYRFWFFKDVRAVRAEGPCTPRGRYGTLSAYRWDARRSYVRWAAVSQAVSWAGFAAAALATVLALWSLASNVDIGPTLLPIVLLVVAGACIPTQSRSASVVREKAKEAEVPLL